MTTERDVALAIAAGDMPSPSVFCGNTFFACRFTGVGVAWRASLGEFVLRDKGIWLSDEMCARVVGVPVVAEHPARAVLNGEEFYNRVVGIVVYGYVKSNELWAVVRIVDKRAAAIIDAGNFDTSPAVIFDPDTNETLVLSADEKLLIEGRPKLLDHLALVDRSDGNAGVWSKGDAEAVGVATSET